MYEYEIKGGMGQSYCEYRMSKIISCLDEINEITKEIQEFYKLVNRPIITFYELLRKEKHVDKN